MMKTITIINVISDTITLTFSFK